MKATTSARAGVLRCPDTGAICEGDYECPCRDCVPSWAVVECACVNPNTDCYVVFDAAMEPQCSSPCISNDGVAYSCELVQEGDLYHCQCPVQPPCPTDLAQFSFTGVVTSVVTDSGLPQPWQDVKVGDPWTISYRFIRSTPDQDPGSTTGDYPAIVAYQLQIGAAITSDSVAPPSTLIRNLSNPGAVDVYRVSIPVNAGGPPPPTFFMLLEDPTGTAWTAAGLNPRDALPLCGDVVLDRFGARLIDFGASIPGMHWQIRGSVTGHECIGCVSGIAQVRLRGDMNGDGIVDPADLPLFVEAILDPARFDADHPAHRSSQADVNLSGSPEGLDIQPFVDLLLAP